MATTNTTNRAKRRTSQAKGRSKTAARKTKTAAKTTATAQKSQVQRVAESVVDLPVGVTLTAVDRVAEVFEPWTSRRTAERELRSYRTQLTRTFNRAERRGTTARRKANTQAKRTRTSVTREVRRVEREA